MPNIFAKPVQNVSSFTFENHCLRVNKDGCKASSHPTCLSRILQLSQQREKTKSPPFESRWACDLFLIIRVCRGDIDSHLNPEDKR